MAKYLDNTDTYMSVFEALKAAAWWNDCGEAQVCPVEERSHGGDPRVLGIWRAEERQDRMSHVGLAGLVAVAFKDWQTVRWTGNSLVYLGMVGTVLGLIMTVSDLSVDKTQSFESFKAIITAIYVGAGIALYTNLLACIGYLWLGTNAHLLARQEV